MSGSRLLDFYQGFVTDDNGRTIDEILSWSDEVLDNTHDYIQWLFPLPERRRVGSSCLFLSPYEIERFKGTFKLRAKLLHSFSRMLRYLGFVLTTRTKELRIERAEDFDKRACRWLTVGNPNLSGITRILRCLVLLGHLRHAEAFLEALEKVYKTKNGQKAIGPVIIAEWRAAVEGSATARAQT